MGENIFQKKKKILYFEDDEFFAEIIKQKLEKIGFEVAHYKSPSKNPVKLSLKEKPDIIFTDIIMPVMDGFEATKRIKKHERTKNIPIFGMSNLSQQKYINKALRLGMIDYWVSAKHAPDEVVEKIKDLLSVSYKTDENEVKKYPFIGLITRYFTGIILFIFGVLVVFINFLGGLCFLIAGLIILPPIKKRLQEFNEKKQIIKKIPKYFFGMAAVIFFLLGLYVIGSTTDTSDDNSKQVADLEKELLQEKEATTQLAKEKEDLEEKIAQASKVNEELPEEQDGAQIQLEETRRNNLAIANADQKSLYNVLEVVDGDTIKVEKIGTLRLIGIDTPETKDPRKPVQCFGEEASQEAKNILAGKKVYLEFDDSQGRMDKYGRTLAYIFREDGYFFNREIIKNGFAHEYTYNTPYKYQNDFRKAEEDAKSKIVGLWSPDTWNGGTEIPKDPVEINQKPAPVSQPVSTSSPDSNTESSNVFSQNQNNIEDSKPMPTPPETESNSYNCDCSKTCDQLSCTEAQYQLNVCGCKKRDNDSDGIACDSKCQ